jgi:hypothetical protein
MTITCETALNIAIAWPLLVYVTPRRWVPYWWGFVIMPLLVAVAVGFRVEVVHP